ncbi:flavodoxin family protein [Rhizobium ruizarguesonis]
MRVSIVYDSGFGHTARIAQAVADGVADVQNAEAMLMAVGDGPVSWETLEASDAIIFGSPTYNGLVSARFKQFMEDSTKAAWSPQKWRNKIGAGFTNSGAYSGNKLNSLISMALFAAQHGMIWVGLDLMRGNSRSNSSANELNRLGSWLGAVAQSNMDEGPEIAPISSDLQTAAHLGRRVAAIARQFGHKDLSVPQEKMSA